MSTIVTKSGATDREVITPVPLCMEAKDLSSLVSILTEEQVLAYAQRQLTISFRSYIRGLLDATDDNKDPKYSDDYFTSDDFMAECSEWMPVTRVKKSDAEKAQEMLGKLAKTGMSAEEIQAIVQAAMASQGAE